MADSAPEAKLRTRCQRGLMSPICNLVVFKLDNVAIQFLQYSFISQLIQHDSIHIKIGDGHSYDPRSNIMTFNEAEPPWNVIMHEATHAVINACNPGMDITRGTHEACAYLAETMFNIAWLQGPPDLDVPHLTPVVADLARRMLSFSTDNKTGVCDSASVQLIKAYLSKTVAVDVVEKQIAVPIKFNP